jgi:DNA-binding NtrC family response regulator
MAKLLVIDDQERTFRLCQRVMPEHKWLGPARGWGEVEALLAAEELSLDAVLLDLHFDLPAEALLGLPPEATPEALRRARQHQGFHILDAIRSRWQELPVLLMTARGEGLERAADRHQAEEYTYFLDDEDLDAQSLRAMVHNVLEARRGAERDGPIYWGRTTAARRARQRLELLARGRLPVVLGGPTGTGKSLIARHFIHPRSGRKGRFVAVDLSTIPRDLVAAHLFGAARGAYTGAVSDRKGAFEEADGGTLFLDEIGNLSEEAQRMLLTVLQERALCRVGESRERLVDVKLVVATHEDLAQRVRERSFRADLYMRLNPAATVRLPALSERLSDLEGLLHFILVRLSEEGAVNDLLPARPPVQVLRAWTQPELPPQKEGVLYVIFPERTLRELRRHPWPGNLRELALTVENAVMLSLAELGGPRLKVEAAERADLLQVRPKLVRDLLRATQPEAELQPEGSGEAEPWPPPPAAVLLRPTLPEVEPAAPEAPAPILPTPTPATAPTPATVPVTATAPMTVPVTAPTPPLDPRLPSPHPDGGLRLEVRVSPKGGLNRLAVDVERQYFTALYLRHGGDFGRMAEDLLGAADDARKVQLRLNQLGLKVRELQPLLQRPR